MATNSNAIKSEVLDELLAGRDPKTLFESEGLLDELKKALAERVLNAEMDYHLGQDPEQAAGNHRNGSSSKTVLTDSGKLELSIPRDRHARFDPQLIAKYQRRFPGFDQKVIALYARGMSTREIQAHLRELYGVEISPELVSAVTDAVLEEVAAWQNRPLEASYAIVFFDALRVKIRDEGVVKNKAVYLAIGVRCSGHKEILGLWIEQTEGAKFWLRVMSEIRNRGTGDILIAVVDGQGLPRSHLGGVPRHRGADVHRAPDPLLDAIRLMERAQGDCRHAQAHLQGPQCRTGQAAPGRLRGQLLGQQVPGHRAVLATQLGAGDSVLRLRPHRCARSSIPPMRSRACTAKSEKRCVAEAISPATRQPVNSSGWYCETSVASGSRHRSTGMLPRRSSLCSSKIGLSSARDRESHSAHTQKF